VENKKKIPTEATLQLSLDFSFKLYQKCFELCMIPTIQHGAHKEDFIS